MAQSLMGGGTGAANALGQAMFIGAKSAAWNAGSAARAVQMEQAGADARLIWKETGTLRGADGELRQEISDNLAKSVGSKKLSEQRKIYDNSYELPPPKVSDVLNHPELFRSYPELAQTRVGVFPSKNYPNAQTLNGGISFNPALNKLNMTSEGLHEIQHLIQNKEGFARGGNYESPNYNELLGEVEARATQARMQLNAAQRREKFPPDSYDVPPEYLKVRK